MRQASNHSVSGRRKRRGAVLVWFALSLVGILGFLGVAADIGRMYIVRNEGQSFVDSVALAAAAELDATPAGITRATNAGTIVWNKYHFSAGTFSAPEILFSKTKDGGWTAGGALPNPPLDYRFVRVTATVANLKMSLMPILTGEENATVKARAVAGQVRVTSVPEGLFPFSPFAHTSNPTAGDGYGLIKGQSYTIRWPGDVNKDVDAYFKDPAKPDLNAIKDWCPGDKDPAFLAALNATSGVIANEHGYIETNAASVIRDSILGGYQSFTKTIGDTITFPPGVKNTEYDALLVRVNADTNQVIYGDLARTPALNWAAFDNASTGYYNVAHNYRRIVVMPIARAPDAANPNAILDFAGFLLGTAPQYPNKNPHEFWCAMYLGSGVEWTNQPGASLTGLFELRLVQ